jgi:uncharacterized membrane protein
MTVSTTASTPPGSYQLTVKGTSGPVSRTAIVTLVVNTIGDFSISATPTTKTVRIGASTTYAVAITPNQGFASNVSLSVGTMQKFVTATFSPASLASGTATLTLATKKQTKAGTYTVVITATGGGLTHSMNVTLVVQ